jgi:hypothetical protein
MAHIGVELAERDLAHAMPIIERTQLDEKRDAFEKLAAQSTVSSTPPRPPITVVPLPVDPASQ